MIRRWSFFDLSTGEFRGRRFSAPDDRDLQRNTPTGCGTMEGSYDPISQRVDLDTGRVVEWENTKLVDAKARRDASLGARVRIKQLEDQQGRIIREDVLRPDERADGKLPRERLQEIDDEIASLRVMLNGETDTSERAG
jgi:hypothetical protein